MFWFKKKEIVLDCFTTDPFAFEYAPISHASKHIPEWWKDLPSHVTFHNGLSNHNNKEVPSMKACRGFTDLFMSSYVLPFWGHLQINLIDGTQLTSEYDINYTLDSGVQPLVSHLNSQFTGFTSKEFKHIKLASPWKLRTNTYVKFLLGDCIWNRRNLTDYNILPGVLDFKYQPNVNINLMSDYRQSPRLIKFEPASPLAMITPLSEKNIELKLHLIDNKEMEKVMPFNRINYPWQKAESRYSNAKKFIQNHDDINKPKCPFGFGK